MKMMAGSRLVCLSTLLLLLRPAIAQSQATLPSEMPAKFEPVTDSFDYIKRDVMIPMRDGVKLHTVIVIPKGRRMLPSF